MIRQTWRMAKKAIGANKMRTFLTMLGIIIGVAALNVLVSIADGASTSVSGQISQIGANYLTVQISDDKEKPIRLSEFFELFNDDAIEEAAPVGRSSAIAKSGYNNGTINVIGTTGSYFQLMNMEVEAGRTLKQTDVENHSYVIVITADTAQELFGYTNAVGETLALDGKNFQVVGILSKDSTTQTSGMMSSSDDESIVVLEAYIPYSTLSRMADNVLDITQFYVSSADEKSMDQAKMQVQQTLLERLKNDEDAFTIQSQSEVMEAMEEVDHTMSLMLGGIAAISLLVGGIGIMNIMLVSVTERTREIGIRKAIGAGQTEILMQFLMEALMVSMAGCLIGIGVSAVILKIAGILMAGSMSFSMNLKVIAVSVAFSALIGIGFGIYPARKAALKKPIDALRYSG